MNLIERLRKRATDSPSFVLLEQAADEIERLTAENGVLLADAERYRWLKDHATEVKFDGHWMLRSTMYCLDASIDAVRKA